MIYFCCDCFPGKDCIVQRYNRNAVADLGSFIPTAAPSAIVSAIEATGRDAILRGSGASNSESGLLFPFANGFVPRLPLTVVGAWCCYASLE